MQRRFRSTPRLRSAALALAVVLGSTTLAFGVHAQQPPASRASPQGILVDFQDTDLRVVITALAEAAGLNVVFGELPARRLTLRIRQPLPADSVRVLLVSVAEAYGIHVTDESGILRFDARQAAPVAAPAAPSSPAAGPEKRLFVYPLRHARAARLAATLQAIFGGAPVGDVAEVRQPSLSQSLREQQIPPMRADAPERGLRSVVAPPEAGSIPAQLQSEVQIVPDENTNALLVRASASDWEIVRQAIEAVDLRPLQVLIEVLIVEVRRTRDLELSVSASAAKNEPGQATPRRTAELKGVTTGDLLLRWSNGGGIDVNVALSVLSERGDVRIIARPALLAQSNQEARILVGSQRPFVQVFRSLPTDAGVRDQIVQYRDVGTSLTIVPTVNVDGYVNLELRQEVSSATNETQFGAPVISTREASTFLFVRDGQTTVIGGLIDRQSERTRSGIPILMEIPLLGALFGTTRSTSATGEMFLFLTPHVVRNDEELDRLRQGVEERVDHLQKETRKLPPVVRTVIPPTEELHDDSTVVRPRGPGSTHP